MTKELTSNGDKIETARLQAAQSLRDACHTCVQIDGCQAARAGRVPMLHATIRIIYAAR